MTSALPAHRSGASIGGGGGAAGGGPLPGADGESSVSGAGASHNDKPLSWHLADMSTEQQTKFLSIMLDPLSVMTAQDRELVWKLRYALKSE